MAEIRTDIKVTGEQDLRRAATTFDRAAEGSERLDDSLEGIGSGFNKAGQRANQFRTDISRLEGEIEGLRRQLRQIDDFELDAKIDVDTREALGDVRSFSRRAQGELDDLEVNVDTSGLQSALSGLPGIGGAVGGIAGIAAAITGAALLVTSEAREAATELKSFATGLGVSIQAADAIAIALQQAGLPGGVEDFKSALNALTSTARDTNDTLFDLLGIEDAAELGLTDAFELAEQTLLALGELPVDEAREWLSRAFDGDVDDIAVFMAILESTGGDLEAWTDLLVERGVVVSDDLLSLGVSIVQLETEFGNTVTAFSNLVAKTGLLSGGIDFLGAALVGIQEWLARLDAPPYPDVAEVSDEQFADIRATYGPPGTPVPPDTPGTPRRRVYDENLDPNRPQTSPSYTGNEGFSFPQEVQQTLQEALEATVGETFNLGEVQIGGWSLQEHVEAAWQAIIEPFTPARSYAQDTGALPDPDEEPDTLVALPNTHYGESMPIGTILSPYAEPGTLGPNDIVPDGQLTLEDYREIALQTDGLDRRTGVRTRRQVQGIPVDPNAHYGESMPIGDVPSWLTLIENIVDPGGKGASDSTEIKLADQALASLRQPALELATSFTALDHAMAAFTRGLTGSSEGGLGASGAVGVFASEAINTAARLNPELIAAGGVTLAPEIDVQATQGGIVERTSSIISERERETRNVVQGFIGRQAVRPAGQPTLEDYRAIASRIGGLDRRTGITPSQQAPPSRAAPLAQAQDTILAAPEGAGDPSSGGVGGGVPEVNVQPAEVNVQASAGNINPTVNVAAPVVNFPSSMNVAGVVSLSPSTISSIGSAVGSSITLPTVPGGGIGTNPFDETLLANYVTQDDFDEVNNLLAVLVVRLEEALLSSLRAVDLNFIGLENEFDGLSRILSSLVEGFPGPISYRPLGVERLADNIISSGSS